MQRKAITAFVTVLFALVFFSGGADATWPCINGTINGTVNGTACSTSKSTFKILLSQVSIVSPWFAPSGIRDKLLAVFEIVFSEDLYLDRHLLTSYSLADPFYDLDSNTWFPGEIGYNLEGTLKMTCGDHDINVNGQLWVLPAVSNPLGLIYGWQWPFDNTTDFPADQLVLVLNLNQVVKTDSGRFTTNTLFDFDEETISKCSVKFSDSFTNKNGTLVPADIVNFTLAVWNDCDPETLATEKEAIASAIDDFASHVALWSVVEQQDNAGGAALAYAALPLWSEVWTTCEGDTRGYVEWSYKLESLEDNYCNKTSYYYNLTCVEYNGVTEDCLMDNKKYDADPCCDPTVAKCCVDHAIFYEGDKFGDYAITDAQCDHTWSVENALHKLTDDFDTNAQDFTDTVALIDEELYVVDLLYYTCADYVYELHECVDDTGCFTAFGCQEGYCAFPNDENDANNAFVLCVAYNVFTEYDLETDTEKYAEDVEYMLYQDMANFLIESGYVTLPNTENITDAEAKAMAEEFLLSISDAKCTDSYYDGHTVDGWICPDEYPQTWIDFLSYYDDNANFNRILRTLCWYDAVPTNVTGCLDKKNKHCNWATEYTTLALCNSTLRDYGLTGVCYSAHVYEIATVLEGCYLLSVTLAQCSTYGGTAWDDFDACVLESATTEAQCYAPFNFLGSDYGKYVASDDSFCYYKNYNKTQCSAAGVTAEWSPLLGACFEVSAATMAACHALGNTTEWYQKRIWHDTVLDNETDCTGLFCENGYYGVTEKECSQMGGSCNVKCDYCMGSNMYTGFATACIIYSTNITQTECQSMHNAVWAGVACQVPAITAADCAKYSLSHFLDCRTQTVAACDNIQYSNLEMLSCGVRSIDCETQHDCFASFECKGPDGDVMSPTDSVYCLALCDDTVANGVVLADAFPQWCQWYAIGSMNNKSCVEDLHGLWVTYPETKAECDDYAAFFAYCKKVAGNSKDFNGCTDCGVEKGFFTSKNGVWTNYTLVPSVTLDIGPLLWMEPALVLYDVYHEINTTSYSNFNDEFNMWMLENRYTTYATDMFKLEASPLQKVACFCVGNNTNSSVCAENNEMIYANFTYDGTAVTLTYSAMYPGGSVLTLHLPAGLQSGLVVSVKGKPITDIAYSSSSKRATDIEVGIFSGSTQLADITADGFDVSFSVQPLSAAATMCVTNPDFLIVQDAYTVSDFSSFVDPTFTILDLNDVTYSAAADNTCANITTGEFYFAIQKPAPPSSSSTPPTTTSSSSTLPIISSSEDHTVRNLALIALVCLVLLIIIPVVIIAVIVAFRSKICKKGLRRVAPK